MTSSMRVATLLALPSLYLLNAVLVVGDAIETRWALLPAQLSLELVVFALAAAVVARRGWRLRGGATWALASALGLVLAMRLGEIVMPWYFGRDFNLVVDLAFMPVALDMVRAAMSAAKFAVMAMVVIAALLAIVALLRYLLLAAWRAAATARVGAFATIAIAALLAYTLVPARYDLHGPLAFSTAGVVVRNAKLALDASGVTGTDAAVIQSALAARPPGADLAGLRGRNVMLIFVESYGAITLTDPEFRAELAALRARWEERLPRAGYHLVSDLINSPITGGGSWLAHASMNFGVRVDSQPLFDVLLSSRARPLGAEFRAAGYRTVAAQPRMQQPWLLADFFGFDAVIDDAALAYRGRRFSWESIPDQFALEQVHARELANDDGRPRFVMHVLSSSHAPFDRVPALVEDNQALRDARVFESMPARSFPPPGGRIFDNRAGYVAALRYALEAVEHYLATRLRDDTLVIVLGDHQPPLSAAAASRNRAVPIHVLSRDPALVEPFRRMGFVAGAVPARTTTEHGMERFLADFLAAYGGGS
jgi:hypothetical protein